LDPVIDPRRQVRVFSFFDSRQGPAADKEPLNPLRHRWVFFQ
jgi:hypothetical protein